MNKNKKNYLDDVVFWKEAVIYYRLKRDKAKTPDEKKKYNKLLKSAREIVKELK